MVYQLIIVNNPIRAKNGAYRCVAAVHVSSREDPIGHFRQCKALATAYPPTVFDLCKKHSEPARRIRATQFIDVKNHDD